VDLRPAVTDARIQKQAPPQIVEARLWQDPFAAVEKSREKLVNQDTEQQCQGYPVLEALPCKVPLGEGDGETLVIAVTVPGAPYPEDAERRRRTRYAVLAGLERAGFVPEDMRHIGYFVWTHSFGSFEQEIPPALPLLSSQIPPAKHIASATTASATIVSAAPLFGLLQGLRFKYIQLLSDTSQADPTIVPYERFDKVSRSVEDKDKGVSNSILVLWLGEDALKTTPLAGFSSLIVIAQPLVPDGVMRFDENGF
jgi:hypothetical protein